MMGLRVALSLLLLFQGVHAAGLQERGGSGLDGERILRNIEARWAAVKDYTVTLEVVPDIEQMDIPPMVARMFFKQPDKIHFESEGFALLPRDALRLNPWGIRDRFSVESVGRDTVSGKYRLRLLSRGESTPARRLTVIVHPKEFTIDGLESGTSDGRRMKAVFTHTRSEEFLLPSSLVVEFTSDAPAESPAPELSGTPARPRKGRVTVTFTDYRLNTQLPDDLFSKKEP